jgi:hydrogenase/urease accessory protein HupE
MNAQRWLIAAAAFVLSVQPAFAHPPPLGIGGFPGGLIHPLFVPAHAMAVLALGLLIGQQATWTRLAATSFVAGLAVGLGVMTLGVVPTLMNEFVLGGALLAGLLAAFGRSVSETVGCVLAVLLGFCIALDSPPEAISLTEANLMLIGTGVGASALLIAVIAIAFRRKEIWTRVAARIIGSWIAASAIMVLVLRFAR